MERKLLTLRVDPEIKNRLESVAYLTDRTVQQVVGEIAERVVARAAEEPEISAAFSALEAAKEPARTLDFSDPTLHQ